MRRHRGERLQSALACANLDRPGHQSPQKIMSAYIRFMSWTGQRTPLRTRFVDSGDTTIVRSNSSTRTIGAAGLPPNSVQD